MLSLPSGAGGWRVRMALTLLSVDGGVVDGAILARPQFPEAWDERALRSGVATEWRERGCVPEGSEARLQLIRHTTGWSPGEHVVRVLYEPWLSPGCAAPID